MSNYGFEYSRINTGNMHYKKNATSKEKYIMPKHEISLSTAIEMTALYRQEKDNILALPFKGLQIMTLCETFDRAAFDTLLSEDGCTAVRIYYGMSPDLKMHAIVVGVNSSNEDILPPSGTSMVTGPGPVILEESFRCPDDCPPKSPLNP